MKGQIMEYAKRVRLPLAAALALLAGHAAAVAPVGAADQQPLTVTATRQQSTLKLGELTVRQTAARIANQRVFTFEGSPTVLVVWEEYTGAKPAGWFALSTDGGRTVAQVVQNPGVVRLRQGTFDPLREGQVPVPPGFEADGTNELFLVQFVATPLEEMRRQVRAAGGEVLAFLTENTHLVRLSPATRDAVAALPFVRWVGAYHPGYRLDEQTLARLVAGEPVQGRFSISAVEIGAGPQSAIADLVKQLGGEVHFINADQYRMEATLTAEQLRRVLVLNEVGFIDPMGPMEQDMDQIVRTGGAFTILWPAGIQGQGVRGEVFDGGGVPAHVEWASKPALIRTTSSNDAHGTACYGINFASGSSINARGLCYMHEQGMVSRYQDTNQAGLGSGAISRFTLNSQAVAPALQWKSCYQTSSVGSPRSFDYTNVSQEVDDYLFRVDYLSFQSQSNAGTRHSRPQAWAKNIVSIGGIDTWNSSILTDDRWATGASIGPATDLRVKPDLAHSYGVSGAPGAPNNQVFTTYSSATTGYGQFNGTSAATPISAGHGGLLTQMWHLGVFAGHGGQATVFLSRPRSTTAKALLINGAHRYTYGVNNMTRNRIGWGLPDLTRLYNDRAKHFVVNADEPLANAQTRAYSLTVGPAEPEFRATMVYPDPAPLTVAGQNRVNDLTLRVTSPNGTVYWGNNGMVPTNISDIGGSNSTTPGGAANTYDTVENVFVQNPLAGEWTVEIIATQVVQDGYLETGALDAIYSLVVANVTPGLPPVACYANCDESTTPPILNVGDFGCFLTKYAAGDAWANCDESTTPPSLNVGDFGCFLTKYAAGCP
ncbi:MAG: S8 family serine peptidase [Phycisphaerales bacterium]